MKYIGFFFFFIVIQVFSQKKYTQIEVDSLMRTGGSPKIVFLLKKMLETDSNLVGWSAYYKQKCYHHLVEKENDSVLFYGRMALELFKDKQLKIEKNKKEEPYIKGVSLYMGIVLLQEKKYKESVKSLLRASRLINKYPDFQTGQNPYIYGYLASNFIEMGNKKDALFYRLKVSKDSVYMSNPKKAAITYNRLGILYDYFEVKDSAFYYHHKSLKKRLKIDDFAGARVSYDNIGNFHRIEQNIDSALWYFDKAKETLQKYPEENYGMSKYFTISNYGFALIYNGQPDKAVHILNAVLDTINKIDVVNDNIKELKISTYDYLTEAYTILKKPVLVSSILREKNIFLEKFYQQILDEQLQELNIYYESQEKQNLINELELSSKIQKSELRQKNVLITTSIIVALFLFFSLFLYIRNKKIKTKYQTTVLEQHLLRTQLNPHFLFNALTILCSLVQKKSENSISYIIQLSNLLRSTLENSQEEFILLSEEVKALEGYMKLQSNFSQKFSFNFRMDYHINPSEILIPPMFIQPFVENSIQHGFNQKIGGHIDISFTIEKEKGLIRCLVKDNGSGIREKEPYLKYNLNANKSYSGRILSQRLKIYSKSMKRNAYFIRKVNEDGIGTEVQLYLPYINLR